jgi:D-alanine-D-alanine ligase
VIASSIAMDKEISKKIFLKNKILTPKYIKYKFNIFGKNLIAKIQKKLNFPVVIKPINEGSSVNVYICDKKNLKQNLKKLVMYKEILIEEFIAGKEIQVAILGQRKLGAIELRPKRKFYDYEAKYNIKAKTQHIIPVDLRKKNLDKVMNIAFKAHNLIGCRGVTRSDFKFHKGKFYLLEINTQPGMTKLSLVPEIAAFAKMSFIDLIEWILKDASTNR